MLLKDILQIEKVQTLQVLIIRELIKAEGSVCYTGWVEILQQERLGDGKEDKWKSEARREKHGEWSDEVDSQPRERKGTNKEKSWKEETEWEKETKMDWQ